MVAETEKSVSKKKTTTKKAVRKELMNSSFLEFTPYKEKKGEKYMNSKQSEHFKSILLSWLKELQEEVDRTVDHMQNDANHYSDPNDRATQ